MNLDARIHRLLAVLFFISGGASLMYQTVWIRKFSLILGGTTYSMSVVVSTFMAGLAVGAALFGRIADRVKRPLVLYAALELCIAVCAVILSVTDKAREAMVVALIKTPALEGTLLVRISIVAIWLGVPCILIGGTLPVMVRFVVRRLSSLGQHVGQLYFVNTLGAAVGALLTGLVLIELFGLSGATFIAMGINLAVAAGALLIERMANAAPPVHPSLQEPEAPSSPPVRGRPLIIPAVAFFISGFCALVLEMSWTRLLLGFLQASVLIIAMNLAVVLLGFAVGGVAISRIADSHPRPGALAAVLFVATGLVGVAGLSTIDVLGLQANPNIYAPDGIQLAGMMGLMLPSSILMGATFPVLVRVLVTSQEKLGTELGSYYALNTIGTVVGGVAAPFFLIPRIGTAMAVIVAVCLQVVAGLLLLAQNWKEAPGRLRNGAVAIAALALVLVVPNRDKYHEALTEVAFERMANWSLERAYIEGPDSTVALYEADEIGMKSQFDNNRFRIQVNASPLVAFDTNETKLMAHLPLLAVPDPKRALVICFGMGNTFRAALAHGIDVDVADINGAVPVLARIHQKDPSKTFDNPRGKIIINDGRNFLLLTPHKYDMITIDPAPPVWGVGLGNIQSQEFYQLMADRLTDQGVVESWMLSGLEGDYEATLAAFRKVFPYVAVFRGVRFQAYHVLGSKHPIRISASRLKKLFNDPRLLEDLGETDLGYFSPELFKKLYVTDTEGVDRTLAGTAPLTDDRPMLEYRLFRGFAAKEFFFPKEVFKTLELDP